MHRRRKPAARDKWGGGGGGDSRGDNVSFAPCFVLAIFGAAIY
jgi:hypothetical protein